MFSKIIAFFDTLPGAILDRFGCQNLNFSTQREGEKAPKISLRQKLLKERDLENIDFSLVFAVFFAMAPFAGMAKIHTLECAAWLEKRTENTQKNIGKIDKNRQN